MTTCGKAGSSTVPASMVASMRRKNSTGARCSTPWSFGSIFSKPLPPRGAYESKCDDCTLFDAFPRSRCSERKIQRPDRGLQYTQLGLRFHPGWRPADLDDQQFSEEYQSSTISTAASIHTHTSTAPPQLPIPD